MRPAVAAILLAALAAGCFGGDGDGRGRGADSASCLPFPHPCGEVWPADLAGPFQLQPGMPQAVTVPSHDGTALSGWLFLPELPEGVLAPTLLVVSPYYGLDQEPPGDDPGGITSIARFVENGYAVAAFSVRGTGVSGGCFANKGLAEQLDQVVLVEWLAEQSWSNGRIAMGGTSYPGTTPFMAAIHQAPHLVTILPNGPVTDPYTELHTPQGALYTMGGVYEAGRRGLVTGAPLSGLAGGDGLLPPHLALAAERLCPDVAQVLAGAELGHFTDDRDAAFWTERQLILGFPDITASVFLSHGLQETAHPFQEDIVWQSLMAAPKRMLLGQWDHQLPVVDDWQGEILAWLDYWLKGIGTPESVGIGRVDYQDTSGAWHSSSAWPPIESELQAHYFQEGRLSGTWANSAAAASFLSAPPPPRQHTGAPLDHLCGTGVPGTALVYTSLEPAFRDGWLAGNPFVHLHVTSNQPGGLLSAHLFHLRAGDPCESAALLTSGAADLRFHDGAFVGHDFPVDHPTPLRIDFDNVAASLAAGDTLALVLSFGDSLGLDEVADPITDARVSRSGQPYAPLLTIHPVVDGGPSFLALPQVRAPMPGGLVPVDGLPPRPFVP